MVIKSISFNEAVLEEVNERRKENNETLSGFVNKCLAENLNINIDPKRKNEN